MSTLFKIKDIDRKVYQEELAEFLPEKLIDIHTHIWLDKHKNHDDKQFARVVTWPALVAKDNSIEDLLETYRLMFPGKEVKPLCFSLARPGDDLSILNDYVSESVAKFACPAIYFATPDQSGEELEQKIVDGGFLGIKVYLNFSPDYIPMEEIRIFDFLPHHQLEVMNRNKWIVMLHIPRNGRLKDMVNLMQMLEIEEKYPDLKLIIAHVGRAYCNEDIGNAFEILADTKNMLFDFCANTNDYVFEQLIKAVGPERILFGSDLPILRMRMKRICKDGRYINIVPQGMYGDLSNDKNMKEVTGKEAEELTFFMYEEIRAFKRASERCGLGHEDIEKIFYGNSAKLIHEVSWGRYNFNPGARD